MKYKHIFALDNKENIIEDFHFLFRRSGFHERVVRDGRKSAIIVDVEAFRHLPSSILKRSFPEGGLCVVDTHNELGPQEKTHSLPEGGVVCRSATVATKKAGRAVNGSDQGLEGVVIVGCEELVSATRHLSGDVTVAVIEDVFPKRRPAPLILSKGIHVTGTVTYRANEIQNAYKMITGTFQPVVAENAASKRPPDPPEKSQGALF